MVFFLYNNTPCSLSYSVIRQGILNEFVLTSSRLDDFSDLVTYIYTVMITRFFWEEGENFEGEASTPQIPERKLKPVSC